jgi:hypothetical protein
VSGHRNAYLAALLLQKPHYFDRFISRDAAAYSKSDTIFFIRHVQRNFNAKAQRRKDARTQGRKDAGTINYKPETFNYLEKVSRISFWFLVYSF